MKTGIFILICYFFIIGPMAAQNPTRTLLYKLSETEEIHAGEYSLSVVGNSYRIAYVVGDYDNNRFRFLINDKIIGEFEEVLTSFSTSRVNFVNLEQENGYVFSYSKDNQWFINNMGKVNGPFQNVKFLYSETDPNAFAYKKDGQWFQSEAGVVKGPFTGGTPMANFGVQNKRGDYIFYAYDDEGNNFFNYNNKMLGPFEDVNTMPGLNERGDYCIEFKKNGQWYALVNAKEYGPYLAINGTKISASGDFMIAAYDDQLKSSVININGKTSRVNGKIQDFVFNNPQHYALVYSDDKAVNWIQTPEKVSGPFSGVHSLYLSIGGKLTYVYNADKMSYLRYGNDLLGPFKYVYIDLYEIEKDELTYVYNNESGNSVVMHQGKFISTEDLEKIREQRFGNYFSYKGAIFSFNPFITELEAENKGVTYKFQISFDHECVIINDQLYGKSIPLNAWYNQNSKSFLWFSQEDRELVLYQFKL
jgi:hypothetical protein